jgi:choline transport protein
MVGFSCTIMVSPECSWSTRLFFANCPQVTWEGLLTIFNVGLQDGGPAGLVYGFLFCWAGYTAVVASLAELTSRFPTAGGQYHWTYELAPPKYRNFISWITGQYLPMLLRAAY